MAVFGGAHGLPAACRSASTFRHGARLWGVLSLGFIVGGLPSRATDWESRSGPCWWSAIIMWTATMIFPVQPSISLLAAGILAWTLLVPFIEADPSGHHCAEG